MASTKPKTTADLGAAGVEPVAGAEQTARVLFGRVLCVIGLIFAAVGAVGVDMSFEAIGIVMGALGYAMGANRLGAITVVLSTATLILLLAASQGYIPGPWPMDPLAP